MADASNVDVSAGSFTDVLSERIGVLMAKYDTDGDGQISFDEFKAKATDMVPRRPRAPTPLLNPGHPNFSSPDSDAECLPWPWPQAGGERRAIRARGGAAG